MKLTFFYRLILAFFSIIFLSAILTFFFTEKTIHSFYLDFLSDNLISEASAFQKPISVLISTKKHKKLQTYIDNIGSKLKNRITVINLEGLVLADSEENFKVMDNHKYRPEVIEAIKGNTGKSLRYSHTVKADMLYIALPLYINMQISGVLRFSLYTSRIDTLLKKIERELLFVFSMLIIPFTIAAYFFSRSISNPMKQIFKASSQIANGNYDIKIKIKGNDEFAALSKSFIHMVGEVKSLIADISSQKDKLALIISSIQEGLLVINDQHEIILANTSFLEAYHLRNIIGMPYEDGIKIKPLFKMINTSLNQKKILNKEIQVEGKYYLVSSAFIESRKETVFLFHDITRVEKLKTIKKNLVSSVSHELKTPLTSIKGYIELLGDEIGDNHYLEIVKKNTKRLSYIVNDLLLLAKLEDHEPFMKNEKVEINNIINQVIDLFNSKAEEKNLQLTLIQSNKHYYIKGDDFKLQQLFINLIDNAITYTETGAVTVKIESKNDDVIVKVIDTGIGIERKHHSRLFERFYVVDKSRSRKTGGTGLGLAIVKHIVSMHDGFIQINSRTDEGTTFEISFPSFKLC